MSSYKRSRHTPKPRGPECEEPEWTRLTVRNPDNPLTYTPTNIRDGLDYGEYKHNKTKLHGPEPLPKSSGIKIKSKAEFPPWNSSKYIGKHPLKWLLIKEMNRHESKKERVPSEL